jgi:hypothetical protein
MIASSLEDLPGQYMDEQLMITRDNNELNLWMPDDEKYERHFWTSEEPNTPSRLNLVHDENIIST